MSMLKFLSVSDLKKFAENLNLSIEVNEELIKKIRQFHFIKSFTYKEIKDQLNLPLGKNLDKFF
ncbi:MAG: hypothetical protein ACTSPD_18675 [Promethearchaeota archaeon]